MQTWIKGRSRRLERHIAAMLKLYGTMMNPRFLRCTSRFVVVGNGCAGGHGLVEGICCWGKAGW